MTETMRTTTTKAQTPPTDKPAPETTQVYRLSVYYHNGSLTEAVERVRNRPWTENEMREVYRSGVYATSPRTGEPVFIPPTGITRIEMETITRGEKDFGTMQDRQVTVRYLDHEGRSAHTYLFVDGKAPDGTAALTELVKALQTEGLWLHEDNKPDREVFDYWVPPSRLLAIGVGRFYGDGEEGTNPDRPVTEWSPPWSANGLVDERFGGPQFD